MPHLSLHNGAGLDPLLPLDALALRLLAAARYVVPEAPIAAELLLSTLAATSTAHAQRAALERLLAQELLLRQEAMLILPAPVAQSLAQSAHDPAAQVAVEACFSAVMQRLPALLIEAGTIAAVR